MMKHEYYQYLANQSLSGQILSKQDCLDILNNQDIDLLLLLQAAYQVRRASFGQEVRLHVLNNAQNGHCPEDCHYCAQAKSSTAEIESYGMKPDEEMLVEARQAYAKGASCYCMVYAGRGASKARVERLKRILSQIKSEFPDKEICVSTGFVDLEAAKELKTAGLDRLNHNLNTSQEHYPQICTTHTYQDRLNTILAAKNAGLKVCSGMIVGMGEQHQDIIDVALQLREVNAESIPVNLLVPIEGNALSQIPDFMNPQFCLRVLCLFRFLNPKAEIRIAAGREMHLRSMEVMGLYPANSIFLQGYLNAKGETNFKTLTMIRDAGFSIKSDFPLEDLISSENKDAAVLTKEQKALLKGLQELRPAMS